MLYIGVDLGTSAVKLLLMDEKGGIKKIVSKEYDLYFPHPGWSEQKPEDWYTQSMEGIKELISECDKSQVSGISFGGQMHGLVVLDENDNVKSVCEGTNKKNDKQYYYDRKQNVEGAEKLGIHAIRVESQEQLLGELEKLLCGKK